MVKEGKEVSYQRWAEAAGVGEAELKSKLQAGYCCRERLIVTTEWLVRYIARTYTGMGTAFDDLLQVATSSHLFCHRFFSVIYALTNDTWQCH
jgi:RNA polymerase primary sigma factor/RNA polymerase sigma factor